MRFLRTFRIIVLCLVLFSTQAFAASLDSTSFTPPEAIKASGGGSVPVGTIIAWPAATNPDDWDKWLECNGQTINAAVYPELAALMGATVPNLQGRFLRGLGGNSAALGVQQGDAMRNFTGTFVANAEYQGAATGVFTRATYGSAEGWTGDVTSRDRFTLDPSRQVPTANENRPVNMAVRYLIRAAN